MVLRLEKCLHVPARLIYLSFYCRPFHDGRDLKSVSLQHKNYIYILTHTLTRIEKILLLSLEAQSLRYAYKTGLVEH